MTTNNYDYKKLTESLYKVLHDQIATLLFHNPAPGIIDLRLSNLSVGSDEVSVTLNMNSELVQMNTGEWEEEACSVWTTTHTHHYEEDEGIMAQADMHDAENGNG